MFHQPTREEIERWRQRLEDRDFQRVLLQFQRSVYDMFEAYRRETGIGPIRGIIYRDEIKSLESLTEKIARKRREQNKENTDHPGKHKKPYDFDDVRDLAGVKILCPLGEDAEEVARFLFAQTDRVRIVEPDVRAGRREDPGGYRGFNFTVYPAPGRRFELTSLYCEVQIKTMIQEAWDAMTHDLAYKRKYAIPQILWDQFVVLSKTLAAVEEQGQLIRKQIEAVFAQFTKQRHAAVERFFRSAMESLEALRIEYIDLAIPAPANDARLDEATFTPDAIAAINEALRRDIQAKGLTRDHCRIATLVALCSRSPGQAAYAIRLGNGLVTISGNDAWVEMLRASVLWALGRFDAAVHSAEQALRKPVNENENLLRSDFCYYISDAKVFHAVVPFATASEVLRIAETLIDDSSPGCWDTAGFALIVFGDLEAVRRGLELVERAYRAAQGMDAKTKAMAEAFSLRHRELGQARLEDRAWWV